MKNLTTVFLYGLLTWAVPFIVSFFFFSRSGELSTNEFLFKSIMIIVGSVTACFLLVQYFKQIDKDFLKTGLILGLIWLLINWVLDAVILIPMSGMSSSEYVMEIGLRYLVIPVMSLAIGVALANQVKKSV